MKRLISLLLCFALVFVLCACGAHDGSGTSFYYCRSPEQYQYFDENGVIQAEQRDLTGHRNDLKYMMGLYLAGPMEENLIAPFNKSTRLLSIQKEENTVLVELSDHTSTLSDAEFALSCACLTLTCMEFTPCEAVTIVSGSRSITMDRDTILLYDTLPQQETTGG